MIDLKEKINEDFSNAGKLIENNGKKIDALKKEIQILENQMEDATNKQVVLARYVGPQELIANVVVDYSEEGDPKTELTKMVITHFKLNPKATIKPKNIVEKFGNCAYLANLQKKDQAVNKVLKGLTTAGIIEKKYQGNYRYVDSGYRIEESKSLAIAGEH